MKPIVLFCLVATTLVAQDSSSSGGGSDGNATRDISAVGQFFDHDFVNFFAYGNGVWDSRVPQYSSSTTPPNQLIYASGFGWEAGGGVTATHTFKDGGLTLDYRAGYRDYEGSNLGSGQQQTLSFGYNKRLNRHWTLAMNVAGGLLGYGTSYYSAASSISTTPGNPASLDSKFANAGLSLTYAQTRRLSYVFAGNFLYSGYAEKQNIAGQNVYFNPVTTHGVTGSASVLYRLTARTTVGGSYSRTYYNYTGNSGSATIDGMALTLSHQFQGHWQLDLSGGVNHSNASGRAWTPVLVSFDGQTIVALCYCKYDRIIYSPSYQAVISHYYRHSSVSLSGGQSILGGNGLFLASRDQFVNGTFSYSTRRSNFSLGANYSRLSSVSTADAGVTYGYAGASASYGVNLARYLSANGRYDFLHYDNAFASKGLTESRVSFGLSLSTKSVPLTLF